MKNSALLRGLYRLASTGNTLVTFGEALDCYQELLLANNDPDLAERVASVLLVEARNYPSPADWFYDEMRFEAFVAGFGSTRRELAFGVLSNSEIDDDALDLYNARISRFVEETPAHFSG